VGTYRYMLRDGAKFHQPEEPCELKEGNLRIERSEGIGQLLKASSWSLGDLSRRRMIRH